MRALMTVLGGILIGLGGWIALGGPNALMRPVAVVPPTAIVATPSPSIAPSASATARPTPKPIPDGYRVQMPRLRIDLPVHEGSIERDITNQQTPENAAFHLPGTAIPGEGSNTYLYAHARTGMFLSLWEARQGDEVLIRTPDGRALKYVVSEVHPRVPYDDVQWANPSTSERLTLQTSTGPNERDPRFVVVARPAS